VSTSQGSDLSGLTGIEIIRQGRALLAYVVRADATRAATSFFTGEEASFQAGFVVYPAGGAVVPHVHLPVARAVMGTSEMLLVRKGRCIVDIYGADRVLAASRELGTGDLVLLIDGGHGFRMLEDTVLLEVKQGPYSGQAEKERFDPPGEPGPK
jgi:mannose-6-phosphate isomerase-like protein (cupin superfamily)